MRGKRGSLGGCPPPPPEVGERRRQRANWSGPVPPPIPPRCALVATNPVRQGFEDIRLRIHRHAPRQHNITVSLIFSSRAPRDVSGLPFLPRIRSIAGDSIAIGVFMIRRRGPVAVPDIETFAGVSGGRATGAIDGLGRSSGGSVKVYLPACS